jgi:hypothetical protein
MPQLVPQVLKAESSVNAQPKRYSSRINMIAAMDVAGSTGNEIAAALGYTPARVSVIRTSPMYQQVVEQERSKLLVQVVNKKSTQVVEDSVDARLKQMASRAVDTYSDLLDNARSEIVKKTVADEILDRSGHKSRSDQSKIVVQLTEKMADRFERVMGMSDGIIQSERRTDITITKEMST